MSGPGSYLIGEAEKRELMEVIEGGQLYRYGSDTDPRFLAKVLKLERTFADFMGLNHALAVNSGTSALLVAMAALGIGPGDEVIVPGYTFIASITSIVYSRAVPVLAEVDTSLNLDPADVRRKITPRTKAIMLVHMLGVPGKIDEIKQIARENNLFLIEDCAQALGATYKGHPVGHYGEVGTFSFNFYKTITSGDGGMVVMNDDRLYSRAFAFHDQGHLPLRSGVEMGSRTVMGMGLKMNELAAAVVLGQFTRLDEIRTTLRRNKARFVAAIADVKGVEFRELPDPAGDLGSVLTVFLPDEATARAVSKEIGSGVLADSGWHVYNNMEHFLEQKTVDAKKCPFTCPYYTQNGGKAEYHKGMLPQTDALLSRAINISIGVSDSGLGSGFGVTILSDNDEIDRKADTFRAAVQKVG